MTSSLCDAHLEVVGLRDHFEGLPQYLINGNAAALREASAHHIGDIHVRDVLCHTENLSRRHKDTLDAKFKVHKRQRLDLIEVEKVEED